jgi:hypothetical protein
VPKRDYLDLTTANAVVEMVPNSGQMQTPDSLYAWAWNWRADQGLCAQKQESLREILVEGFRCKIAMLIPPLGGPVN